MLEILYQDQDIVVINKPAGLLVHASPIARDAEEFAVQKLRDQLNQYVFPCHRLDRKTAGILVFALHKEAAKKMTDQFTANTVEKEYHAIVRGHILVEGESKQTLTNESGKTQDAHTLFSPIKHTEIDLPSGKFSTSRYTLIHLSPITGRMHQLRKHMDIMRHPIIGDRPYGCNKQNKLFLEHFELSEMMLNCKRMKFQHPITNETMEIKANYSSEFLRIGKLLLLLDDESK